MMDESAYDHHAKEEEMDDDDDGRGDFSSSSPPQSHQQQPSSHQQQQQPKTSPLTGKKEQRNDFLMEGHLRAKFVREWLLLNTEVSEDHSISRNELHQQFQAASAASITVDSATFGKYVRSVYPQIATRRLGKRGNSKYHYQGIKIRDTPLTCLPPEAATHSMSTTPQTTPSLTPSQHQLLTKSPAASATAAAAAAFLFSNGGGNSAPSSSSSSSSLYPAHSYAPSSSITTLSIPSPFAPTLFLNKQLVTLGNDPTNQNNPFDPSRKRFNGSTTESDFKRRRDEAHSDFQASFQLHMENLARALMNFDMTEAENCLKTFWKPLSMERLASFHLEELVPNLHNIAESLYARVISTLLPNPLNPPLIPTIQAIRLLVRNYENLLHSFLRETPSQMATALLLDASNFAMELKQRSSLGLLVHSTTSIFFNSSHIEELAKTWELVDVDSLKDHITWILVGKYEVFDRFYSSFIPPPSMRNSIVEWAQWLRVVINDYVDMNTPNFLEFLTTGKRFLLNWTFFGSLVTRDLAFKSASSFKTFQSLRMFSDEYVLFLLETRLADLKKQNSMDSQLPDELSFANPMHRFSQDHMGSKMGPDLLIPSPSPVGVGFSNGESSGAPGMNQSGIDLSFQSMGSSRIFNTSSLIQLATPPNFSDGPFTLPHFQRSSLPHHEFPQ